MVLLVPGRMRGVQCNCRSSRHFDRLLCCSPRIATFQVFACPVKYEKDRRFCSWWRQFQLFVLRRARIFQLTRNIRSAWACCTFCQTLALAMGKRKMHFGKGLRLMNYNSRKPTRGGHCPFQSLETKWGSMKHNVSKFCGVFSYCYAKKQSGDGKDEIV